MACNESLAEKVRNGLEQLGGANEKKMFGGLCFLVQGNMACGVQGEQLIIRVGPQRYRDALDRPGAKPFDMTGRPMKGFVSVTSEGYEGGAMAQWLSEGVEFARSLPPK
jgi:TfoX/Sxy family transcriptional regulator of competence genes